MRRPATISGLLLHLFRLRARPARRALLALLTVLAGAALLLHHASAPPSAARAHAAPAPRVDPATSLARGLAGCLPIAGGEEHCVVPAALASRVAAGVHANAGGEPTVAALPSVAWDGASYGIAWTDLRNGWPEVYFRRVDANGAKVGDVVRVTNERSFKLTRQLVWTGRDYGLVYEQFGDSHIAVYFQRIARDGRAIGRPVRLSTPNDREDMLPRAAFNGREFGVAWYNFGGSTAAIRFARVSAEGERVGEDRAVLASTPAAGFLDVGASQGEWSIAWSAYESGRSKIELLRLRADGTAQPVLDVAALSGFSGSAAVAATRDGVGVVWEDQWTGYAQRLAFGSVSSGRVVVPRTPFNDASLLAMEPAAVAGADGYGVAWVDNRDVSFSIAFARLGSDGAVRGESARVNALCGEAFGPAVATDGRDYGVAWTLSRGLELAVYFGRVGADGARLGSDLRLSE